MTVSQFAVRLALTSALVVLGACSDDATGPAPATVITVTNQPIHIGDNPGSVGMAYVDTFTVTGSFGSATVSVTFLYPNTSGVSGPEVDNPPQVAINGVELGPTTVQLVQDSTCIAGSGPGREYECDVTVNLSAPSVVVGENEIQVISKGVTPGTDDLVFTDLKVSVRP